MMSSLSLLSSDDSPKRNRKSAKGRKPKRPKTEKEKNQKKCQKNMRETHRRVEINLYYELLYNLLDENLVYNRAERVTLLQKAILEISQLRSHNQLLIKQLKEMDQYPVPCPQLMLNSSEKLYMLVQQMTKDKENGKKCSRAKLKPVGIEMMDTGEDIAVTLEYGTREQTPDNHSDHIPFWAYWNVNNFEIVDMEAFKKACQQAVNAGWDGSFGNYTARYDIETGDVIGIKERKPVKNMYYDPDCTQLSNGANLENDPTRKKKAGRGRPRGRPRGKRGRPPSNRGRRPVPATKIAKYTRSDSNTSAASTHVQDNQANKTKDATTVGSGSGSGSESEDTMFQTRNRHLNPAVRISMPDIVDNTQSLLELDNLPAKKKFKNNNGNAIAMPIDLPATVYQQQLFPAPYPNLIFGATNPFATSMVNPAALVQVHTQQQQQQPTANSNSNSNSNQTTDTSGDTQSTSQISSNSNSNSNNSQPLSVSHTNSNSNHSLSYFNSPHIIKYENQPTFINNVHSNGLNPMNALNMNSLNALSQLASQNQAQLLQNVLPPAPFMPFQSMVALPVFPPRQFLPQQVNHTAAAHTRTENDQNIENNGDNDNSNSSLSNTNNSFLSAFSSRAETQPQSQSHSQSDDANSSNSISIIPKIEHQSQQPSVYVFANPMNFNQFFTPNHHHQPQQNLFSSNTNSVVGAVNATNSMLHLNATSSSASGTASSSFSGSGSGSEDEFDLGPHNNQNQQIKLNFMNNAPQARRNIQNVHIDTGYDAAHEEVNLRTPSPKQNCTDGGAKNSVLFTPMSQAKSNVSGSTTTTSATTDSRGSLLTQQRQLHAQASQQVVMEPWKMATTNISVKNNPIGHDRYSINSFNKSLINV